MLIWRGFELQGTVAESVANDPELLMLLSAGNQGKRATGGAKQGKRVAAGKQGKQRSAGSGGRALPKDEESAAARRTAQLATNELTRALRRIAKCEA